jgi:predicted metal-dependent phosphoesterase TrpH
VPARVIDLHTHSTASDGSTPPAVLVREACEQGLHVLALTDHDTTAGWAGAEQALPPGLSLVRGAELSCVSGGTSLHLLAYLFDPDEPVLAEQLRLLRESRAGRAEAMARRLEEAGTGVTWARSSSWRAARWAAARRPGAGRAGAHRLRRRRLRTGVDRHRRPLLRRQAGARGARGGAPGAAGRRRPGLRAPVGRGPGRTVGDDVIAAMAESGLAGLEVDHVDHDQAARAHLTGLAAELGLLTTGSSDFHGTMKTVRLAAHTTSQASYERLVAEATSGVPVLTG